jgi:hypothetical protein
MEVAEAVNKVRDLGRGEIQTAITRMDRDGEQLVLVVTKTAGETLRYLVTEAKGPLLVPNHFREKLHTLLRDGTEVGKILDELESNHPAIRSRPVRARRTQDIVCPAVTIKRGGRLIQGTT